LGKAMRADLRLRTCAAALLVAGATAAAADAAATPCPVTRPGRIPLPADVVESRPDGALWVSGLPSDGVAVVPPQAGELGLKLGWWKRRLGTLHVEARRLDAPAPPARFRPQDSYSAGFLPSGLTFPAEGCWEVVGRLGPPNYAPSETTTEELRFVLRVVRDTGDGLPATGGFPIAPVPWAAVLGLALIGAGAVLRGRGGRSNPAGALGNGP
jgi:hypothetical protein